MPEFRETNHLFLDLPQFAERLRDWIEGQTDWRPNVKNFSLGLLDELRARPITRDLDWGVRIPVEGYSEDENKRIYVWFDAVIGYLSASIEWAAMRGEPDAWREWWQNPEAEHYYFQGKDNIVFHTVIWPSMLIGYGEGGEYGAGRGTLQLPYNVVATEYLTMRASSSRRAAATRSACATSSTATTPTRSATTSSPSSPETQDTDFTWAEFVRRNNDELLANWGNLVNRTLTNAHRNFGEVPQPGELTEDDEALLATIDAGFDEVGEQIERGRFRAALARGDAALLRGQPVHLRPGALGARQDRPRPRRHRPLRRAPGRRQPQDDLHPVPPAQLADAPRAARLRGLARGPARVPHRSTRTAAARTTCSPADYAEWTGAWQPSELAPGQKLREPTPLFKKLDDSVVDDELGRA